MHCALNQPFPQHQVDDRIGIGHVDHTVAGHVGRWCLVELAMMPVVPNIGGDWAYGPREFLRAIAVDTFIPMHMWGRDREVLAWCEAEKLRNCLMLDMEKNT